ncbi:MAG TPA: class I SAM-dependent methyltransferase, partial [Nocardioidaceae bacterium]|nr:class I SAM-dependent methyltransferase [Nocardioidaceae bacterium]
THFDVWNHHKRRYTRKRAVAAVEDSGLVVRRATHAFAATFPFFAASRLRDRMAERNREAKPLAPDEVPPLPEVSARVDRFLTSLAQRDAKWLANGRDLPFGSSVLVAAEKPTKR